MRCAQSHTPSRVIPPDEPRLPPRACQRLAPRRWQAALLSALVIASMMTMTSAPALAIGADTDELGGALTSCGLVHLGLSTTSLPLMMWLDARRHDALPQRDALARWIDADMRQHPHDWRDALTLGAGAPLDDLARALALSPAQRRALGRRARDARPALDALLFATSPDPQRGHLALAMLWPDPKAKP